MQEAKFIKKEDGFAEYEIDESNKEVADTKGYKAEKIIYTGEFERFENYLKAVFEEKGQKDVRFKIATAINKLRKNEKINKEQSLEIIFEILMEVL